MENSDELRREKCEKGVDTVADLLPDDPFDMDASITVMASTGCSEDSEKDFGLKSLGFDTDQVEFKKVNNQLSAELINVWNSSPSLHPEFGDSTKNLNVDAAELENFLCDGYPVWDGDIGTMGFSYNNSEEYLKSKNAAKKPEGCSEDHCDGNGGEPPYALRFALRCLEVEDLLSVERVCKSLRDAVRNDPLLWRNIHIGHPLNNKITDDTLLKLVNRAQGMLQSLSLVECFYITDTGLKHVLESSPGLTKLSVPNCIKLNVDGILCNLRVFKSIGTPGIKCLRLGDLFGIQYQHFEEMRLLLGAEIHKQSSVRTPRFYLSGQVYLSVDDERPIDIERCPRCFEFRQVYDCPAESCQEKHQTTQSCRGCVFCIARCLNCGRCIDNSHYEETFCLQVLCLDCRKRFLDFQETPTNFTILPEHTFLHQQAIPHFYLRDWMR